jgi:endonuclease V-like protein UPF0215 family
MIPLDIVDTMTRIRAYSDLISIILGGIILAGFLIYQICKLFKRK